MNHGRKTFYPLLFESLEYSTFSKLIKAFPKVSLDETDVKHWLNLLQGILRYKTKDKPSVARIQEHSLMFYFCNKKYYLNQILCGRNFFFCFEDISNAVLINDIPDVNFFNSTKESVEVRGMKNDLPTAGDTGKSSVLMTLEKNSDFVTSDVDARLQGIAVKATKKISVLHVALRQQMTIL